MNKAAPRFSAETRSFFQLAEQAMKVAVAQAIAEHRQAGRPVFVWRNGKVQQLETLAHEIDRKYREAYTDHPVLEGEFD